MARADATQRVPARTRFETARVLPLESGPWRTPGILRRVARFLSRRGLMDAAQFAQLEAEAKAIAFTIAGDIPRQALTIARDSLDESLAIGLDTERAGEVMNRALAARGFDALQPWHARLVAHMAHANAYGFAQRQLLTDARTARILPLARYRHADGVRFPRETHLAMDGFVFDPRGPYAERLRTPGGFGCHCWWEGVPASEAQDLTPDDWPHENGVPVQVLDDSFAPADMPRGIDSREAALRLKLTPRMLDAIPAEWKVISVE